MNSKQRGALIIHTLVFGAVGLILVGALSSWGAVNIRAARQFSDRERAFQIAEAGIEYYRWHLAHAPQDFQDGTGGPGPYTHDFEDRDGQKIGTFTLTIDPPTLGSTIVTVVSEGRLDSAPTLTRKVEARLAIPSIAKYAFLANSDMRFGEGTEVFGPVHSNQGIRFDGIAHNVVTSSRSDYDDPDHTGANEFGVHTHVNPPPSSGTNDSFRAAEAPPSSPVPVRPDIFEAGREFPVPAVDFNGITSTLATIKAAAQNGGRYLGPSGAHGYKIVLKTNDTMTVTKVQSLAGPNNNKCDNVQSQPGWGPWSPQRETNIGTYSIPANGAVFIEDNVWVEGKINTARLTIAASRFPDNPSNIATNAHIIINNDLQYTNYDGRDVIGLIAQGNVNVGMISDEDLQIDAAVVAKNGRVGRYYYDGRWCSVHAEKDSLDFFGMIATNQRYGFAYSDGNGYQERTIAYDGNLLYAPPPFFPLTSDQYQVISWREL